MGKRARITHPILTPALPPSGASAQMYVSSLRALHLSHELNQTLHALVNLLEESTVSAQARQQTT